MKLVVIALEDELPQQLPEGYQKVVTGVGKVNAAIKLSQALCKSTKPSAIINYGTAGIVSNKSLISQLVQPDVIIQRDMMAEPQAPRGVTPFEEDATAGPILMNTNTNITLGTGDSFVMSQDPWFVYASIDLVDMEAYALAKVAHSFNIPFQCYKYVSDFADENAADTWQENVAKGANLFQAVL